MSLESEYKAVLKRYTRAETEHCPRLCLFFDKRTFSGPKLPIEEMRLNLVVQQQIEADGNVIFSMKNIVHEKDLEATREEAITDEKTIKSYLESAKGAEIVASYAKIKPINL